MASISESVIGIDLGTTYTRVGIWNEVRQDIEIITDEHGSRSFPSIVSFTNHGREFGESALRHTLINPSGTVSGFKNLLGAQKKDEKKSVTIEVEHGRKTVEFTPEEVCAMILRKARNNAENQLGCKVTKAAITVPAFFNTLQRQATMDAAKIAGFKSVRLLNNSIASTIAYSNSGSLLNENVLVYDLGGGCFDVAVIHLRDKNDLVVKACRGNASIGGQEFDKRLLAHFVEQLKIKSRVDVSNDKKALRRLLRCSEKAKIKLSSMDRHHICEVSSVYEDNDIVCQITRAMFERLTLDLVEKTISLVDECIKNAPVEKREIGAVLLLGGSSKMPLVQQLLDNYFGKKCLYVHVKNMQEEAPAHGAAIVAAQLFEGNNNNGVLKIEEVTHMNFGVNIVDNKMSIIVPRNSPIPVKKTAIYYTIKHNQKSVTQDVFEGEHMIADRNTHIGTYRVSVVPAPRGKKTITTSMDIDENGILSVQAYRNCCNQESAPKVDLQIGLPKDTIAKLVLRAETLEMEDDIWKEVKALKNRMDDEFYNSKNKLMMFKDKAVGSSSALEQANIFLEQVENYVGEKYRDIPDNREEQVDNYVGEKYTDIPDDKEGDLVVFAKATGISVLAYLAFKILTMVARK